MQQSSPCRILTKCAWSTAQSKLPKNIYNFTIRYINNSLPTRKNLSRWGLSSSSECSFCLGPESLLHVVAECQCYLDRFTWRHNSILNFLANTLQTVNGSALYADVPGSKSPSIITGDTYRPDCCYHYQMALFMWPSSLLAMRQTSKTTLNGKKPNTENL